MIFYSKKKYMILHSHKWVISINNSFKALEAAEFAELRPLFSPLMHTVCLIYSNSKHYNSPSRLIVLMKEVCNLLIGMARKHIDPATLFQIEVQI